MKEKNNKIHPSIHQSNASQHLLYFTIYSFHVFSVAQWAPLTPIVPMVRISTSPGCKLWDEKIMIIIWYEDAICICICIVSVHCLEEGCIGLYIPEVGGDVQPNTSRLETVYGHSLIIDLYQGMYQEIHPCMAGSIDSVKINTSLLMMREWSISLNS